MNHPFAQHFHAVDTLSPVSHLVAIPVIRQSQHQSACVQVTLILLNNGPKAKSSDAGSWDMPKGSHIVFPLSEKICVYRKYHSICRVQYYPWLQASTGGLGMYPHR